MAHLVDQDLAAGAGEAVEAGFLELGQDFPSRQTGQALEAQDLLRGKGVDPEAGVLTFEVAQHLQVPLEGQRRVHTALHQNPVAAHRLEFAYLLRDFLVSVDIGVFLALGPVKGAETAANRADIGIVDVTVN